VGGFFGADIGGTLSKLVFFLPDRELATRMLQRAAARRSAVSNAAASATASVVSTTSMVANDGASMPAPLAIPPMVQFSPESSS
jgi:hypothetical protein